MFFKHFASKNQLPGFYISRTWVNKDAIYQGVLISFRMFLLILF